MFSWMIGSIATSKSFMVQVKVQLPTIINCSSVKVVSIEAVDFEYNSEYFKITQEHSFY